MTTSPQRENESIREYVTRLMEEAVALKGEDYVYEKRYTASGWDACDYLRDGQPSCIVGHVLVAAGIEPTLLGEHEGSSAWSVVPQVAPENWDQGITDALDAAQKRQDDGLTWGDALAAFKRELGLE